MPTDPSLSERELEILRQVATGASNKQIAQQLGISPNTVKVHLRNIFSKIGAPTRTAATLYALENGLAAPPAPLASPREPVPLEPAAPSPTPTALPAKRPARPVLTLGLVLLLVLLTALALQAAPRSAAVGTPTAAALERWQARPTPPGVSRAMAVAGYEGAIYLIGGRDASGQVLAQTTRFRPGLDAWETRAPRPLAAADADAAVLGEKIYLAGGLDARGVPLDRLDIYDPRLDRWESGAALPRPLAGAALTAFEGRLYLFGGSDGVQDYDQVYTYDPAQSAWALAARLPGPRAYAAAAALEGKVLLFGGAQAGTALDATLAFYPARAARGESPWEQRAALPARTGHPAAASLAGMVYLAAPPVWQYDPQEDAWSSLANGPAMPGSSVVSIDTQIHFISGSQHWSYQALYTLLVPLQ